MAVDPLSPIAPARIRALLLPVGRIKRSRFIAYVDLLQHQSLVRLGDISPDARPDRNMFSPLAFPAGTLLYDLSTSMPSVSHLSLSPFEQFREPLLVVGVGDASEYPWLKPSRAPDGASKDAFEEPSVPDEDSSSLRAATDDLREQFPRAYFHTLMMFDSASASRHPGLPQETFLVPPKSQLKTTTMKTIMCDLTATLLAEMTTLAKSIQALPTLVSPASQGGVADSTPSWASSDSTMSQFSRRNSQAPNATRSESPNANAQKDMHRMSMPVLPSSAGGLLTSEDPRAASPSTHGTHPPPTTFDEISGINAANTLLQTPSNSSKPSTATKDSAADRVSIHGFGSGGVGERARNKGRGRISIVTGTLYMCAGQWLEAMKELTDGATRARALSDHLWHAKALEHIMVCLLLFAWSGMDFQIPQICFPTSDKAGSSKSPTHTPTNSVQDISVTSGSHGYEAALENLNSLLPDLVNMILNLYTRAANFAGESLPSLAFSECVIRFSKLLAAMNLSAGYLDEDALQCLVQNVPYKQKPRLSVPRLSVHPTRNDIASMLFRALPGPVEASGMNPTDRVMVLAGVASVLSSLGLQRKKAIVMREFITSLVPGLVQARKVRAAEMGVHPAAGLAALNIASGGNNSGASALNLGEGDIENGIDEFLGLLGRIYGIPNSRGVQSELASGLHAATNGASQDVVDAILRVSSLRAFGSLSVKLDVLRTCLSFCEALPDFSGLLHFTALLLRVAGPGTAPRANSTDVFVSLPRDEQVRLYSNISRTVSAVRKLGLQHVETEYWDDFLVRGLFILEEVETLKLTPHHPASLKSIALGPFLHNPWLKTPPSSVADTVLVANEEYRFLIALQNPYDFEVGVESLKIAAEGVQFDALEEHFTLGPYRTQKFQIAGTARSSGVLKIIGCSIKLIGCRERLFPIFPEPWKPKREPKMKRIGLKACLGAPTTRPSSAIAPAVEQGAKSQPKAESLTFTVIPDQPVIVVTNVSLPQSAVMVLEGEKKQFTVTVRNTSRSTIVDFVHISFQDTATTAIQATASNKDIPAAELHELEVQLAHHPSLRWCKSSEEESLSIMPGMQASFIIEVTGRTRLTDAIIQIDYANLGKRRSDEEESFFTRQVTVPIFVTVNASVQLQRPDVVPLSSDFAWSLQQSSTDHTPPLDVSSAFHDSMVSTNLQAFVRQGQSLGLEDEHCMLLLDLRNSWPNPLSVSLQARRIGTDEANEEESWSGGFAVNEVIQPGHVNRVVLVLPRVYLKAPHAAVPSLNPATQRQFVVSSSKISPEVERASREAFWCRHELLNLVRGTWREDTNGRHGDLELRGIRLSARMVEAIKLDDLAIVTSIVSDHTNIAANSAIRQLGRARFEVPVDEFLSVKTIIRNRSPRPISPLLRLQPHISGLPHNIALDLDKRFSWTGVLQRKLPIIRPGKIVESELGIVALCSGTFEIGATVDEVELGRPEDEEGYKRSRNDTQSLVPGDILAELKLRSWHSQEPCTMVAKRHIDE